jgi:hypothetical protein
MRNFWVVLLLASGFLLAQDNNAGANAQRNSEASNGQITVQGCVSRSTGDYILFKQDPGTTWVLRTKSKLKLGPYLGQQVEVTGTESPFLGTSSSYLARTGPASSVMLTITSIKTISKQCVLQQIPDR